MVESHTSGSSSGEHHRVCSLSFNVRPDLPLTVIKSIQQKAALNVHLFKLWIQFTSNSVGSAHPWKGRAYVTLLAVQPRGFTWHMSHVPKYLLAVALLSTAVLLHLFGREWWQTSCLWIAFTFIPAREARLLKPRKHTTSTVDARLFPQR